MNRGMTSAVIAETKKQQLRMFYLVEFYFSTTDYITTWSNDLTWNNKTYLSSGNLLSISSIDEEIFSNANQLSIEFSGVNQANISVALSENYTDKKVIINLGFLDENYVIITDPHNRYEGRIDHYELQENPTENGSSIITWFVSSHWADFERVAGRRANDNDHQRIQPGDKFFEFASEIVKDLQWGKP